MIGEYHIIKQLYLPSGTAGCRTLPHIAVHYIPPRGRSCLLSLRFLYLRLLIYDVQSAERCTILLLNLVTLASSVPVAGLVAVVAQAPYCFWISAAKMQPSKASASSEHH